MEGVYGASRAVLIAGIAGACASWHPKIASSLGNCCSVGVTTAAGRVAGGVFIFASPLAALRSCTRRNGRAAGIRNRSHGLTGLASNTRPRLLRRPTTPCPRPGRPPAALTGRRGARFDCSQIFDRATAARVQTCFPIRNDGYAVRCSEPITRHRIDFGDILRQSINHFNPIRVQQITRTRGSTTFHNRKRASSRYL